MCRFNYAKEKQTNGLDRWISMMRHTFRLNVKSRAGYSKKRLNIYITSLSNCTNSKLLLITHWVWYYNGKLKHSVESWISNICGDQIKIILSPQMLTYLSGNWQSTASQVKYCGVRCKPPKNWPILNESGYALLLIL